MKSLHTMTCLASLIGSIIAPLLSADADTFNRYSLSSCPSLVRDCFFTGEDKRENCLYRVSTLEACQGSPLGALVAFRAALFNESRPLVSLPSTSLGGTASVNARCVDNFDTSFAGSLILEDMNDNQLRYFAGLLKNCVGRIDPSY